MVRVGTPPTLARARGIFRILFFYDNSGRPRRLVESRVQGYHPTLPLGTHANALFVFGGHS